MLSLKYELSVEDVVNFNYLHWRAPYNSAFRAKYLTNYIVIACIAFLGFMTILDFIGQIRSKKEFVLIGLVILAIIIIIDNFLIKRITIRNKVNKFLENPANRKILLRSEVTIDEMDIRCTDSISDLSYKWDSIEKAFETTMYFFLYTNAINSLIIPKRVLTMQDIEHLQALIRSKVHPDRVFKKEIK